MSKKLSVLMIGLLIVAFIDGCLVSDPAFKPSSKDDIIASRKHVIITPTPQ